MKKQFAVIGLGNFGSTIALELMRHGDEVLGIDRDERVVAHFADRLSDSLIADVSDEGVLTDLGLERFDAVMVAIGESIETSILCTLFLKEIGAREIWVQSISSHHHKIAARLGADRIIQPEYEMGLRVAQGLHYPGVLDFISLGDNDYIVEVEVSEQLDQQPVSVLLENTNDEVHLLLVKRDKVIFERRDPDTPLKTGDRIVLRGKLQQLKELSPRL